MAKPYITKVQAGIYASNAESATEATDAIQKAIFDVQEEAKKRDVEVLWDSMRVIPEGESDRLDGYSQSILFDGPWITFDAIGHQ